VCADSSAHPQNLTLEKATAEGIRHARLPIQQHMKLAGSHVLTVNQVFDLLLGWLELRDWRAACERAVPKRKRGEGDGEEAPLGKKARRLAAKASTLAEGDGTEEPQEEEDEEAAAAEDAAPADAE
jgi:tRNA (guanine9-N1)-methyltransferase